jgi:prevent-host-death family protein
VARQRRPALIRRVEAGESITVTVSGRPAAGLVPAERTAWRRCSELAELFAGPADLAWRHDRELVDGTARDPWATG